MEGVANTTREASAQSFPTGLEASLTVQIDLDEATVYGPTNANVEEYPAGSGIYNAELTLPAVASDDYRIVWHNPAGSGPSAYAHESLRVVATEEELSTPELPPTTLSGRVCTPWATFEDVLGCGYGDDLGSDAEDVYHDYLVAATELLWLLSGKRFASGCPITVRPCEGSHGAWGWRQELSDTATVVWSGNRWEYGEYGGGAACGCCGVSAVKLAGYPVREISSVKIDGVTVGTDEYQLARSRWLVRRADADGNRQTWPQCQRLDRPDTDDGTFAVTYTYGADPPVWGRMAAATLAGEAQAQCAGGECKLPPGVTRETRQGVTVEYGIAAPFILEGKTGLQTLDYFAAGWIVGRPRRRSAVWTPEMRQYARSVGPGGS